jgi:type IV secretion system protein VirB5
MVRNSIQGARMPHRLRRLSALLLVVAGLPAAHGQIPVIDVASLAQLIAQIQTLEQQLSTARNQLTQAESQYQSMTGQRGMQQLLAGTPRNYLPPDWPTLTRVLAGGSGYPSLGQAMRGDMTSNAVLTVAQLAALSAAAGAQVTAQRQSVAILQGVSDTALANASARFVALQGLIDAIGRTDDQKGVLELQARILAEQAMLLNEHTKLNELYRATEAEQWANLQHARELTVATHGQFAARFQPQP